MDRQEIRKGLEEALAIVKEDSSGTKDIPEQTPLVEGLGLDSLQVTELLFEIEEKFGAQVSEEEARELATVGDVIAIIQRKMDEGAA